MVQGGDGGGDGGAPKTCFAGGKLLPAWKMPGDTQLRIARSLSGDSNNVLLVEEPLIGLVPAARLAAL